MSDRREISSLTELSYWEQIWHAAELPRLFDPSDKSMRNRGNVAFHELFSDVVKRLPRAGGSLVEIGCAQSKWLPYFNKMHGLSVTGVDYSPFGCARARHLMQVAGCDGEVVEADMFNPPAALKGRFDAVLSMGLVEHFPRTSDAVAACAVFVRSGGLVVTTIPNLSGLLGFVQRTLDRSVYDKHVPLTREALRQAHEDCGLTVLRSEYMTPANFAIVNHPRIESRVANRIARSALLTATGALWGLDRFVVRVPRSRFLSSYAVCVARKS